MMLHEMLTDRAPRVEVGWLLVQTLPGETTENDLLGLHRSPSRDQNV